MPTRFSRGEFLRLIYGFIAAGISGSACSDFSFGGQDSTIDKKLLTGRGNLWRKIPCRVLGPDMTAAHRLRNMGDRANIERRIHDQSSIEEDVGIAIIGGGIAGLSAAWTLKANGYNDVRVLELESRAGGNSQGGERAGFKYPWGAHYVPIANPESLDLIDFFRDTGIITGVDKRSGKYIYDELFLCHEPQDRLLKDGAFQEGLLPKRGLQARDRMQIERFLEIVTGMRERKDSYGRPGFAIPLDLSSQDPELLELDTISMGQWLEREKFDCRALRWYVDYCCRDDYGALADNVSAWAGIHYFAGRRGKAANSEINSVLTWPEGNEYLVGKLLDGSGADVVYGALVLAIREDDRGLHITYLNKEEGTVHAFRAAKLIFAAPRFVFPYLYEGERKFGGIISGKNSENHSGNNFGLVYPPWLVANVRVSSIPSGAGIDTAWDNVSYYGSSLGYVVSNHQTIEPFKRESVLTLYHPLSDLEPGQGRLLLERLARGESEMLDHWRAFVVRELELMHPEIPEKIIDIELWPWGHGMISPRVGYLWGEERRLMLQDHAPIYFAHSDMSGISNFEEAHYRGINAARAALG